MFVYNVFLKSAYTFEDQADEVVTTNVNYVVSEYKMYADEVVQKGKVKDFTNLSIEYKDSNIRADRAHSKNDKEIFFYGNVKGQGEGWEFDSDEARFKSGKVENFSLSGNVEIKSKGKDTIIKSDQCTFLDNFKRVKFIDNVIVKGDGQRVYAQKADYNEPENLFILTDNVALEVDKKNNEGEVEHVRVETSTMRYNTEREEGTTKDPFTLKYAEFFVKGIGFEFTNKPNIMKALSPVTIGDKGNELDVKAGEGRYEEESIFLGKGVKGKYISMEFEGDKASFANGKTSLNGNVHIKDKDVTLDADNFVHDRDTRIAHATSKEKVKVINGADILETKEFFYNSKTEEMETEYDFHVTGKDYTADGTYLLYNNAKNSGKVKKMVMKGKDGDIIAGDVEFDFSNEKYVLKDNVQIIREGMVIEPELVHSLGNETKFIGKIKIKDEKEDMIFHTADGVHNKETGNFVAEGDFTGNKDDYVLKSKNLKYNTKTELGKLHDAIIVENKEKKFHFTADYADYNGKDNLIVMPNPKGTKDKIEFKAVTAHYLKADSIFRLFKEVEIDREDLHIRSQSLDFNNDKGTIDFEVETDIWRNDLLLIAQKGHIFVDEERVLGEDVLFIRDEGDIIQAGYLEGARDMEQLDIRDNISGDLAKEMKFTSDSAKIFFVPDEEEKAQHKLTRVEMYDNIDFKYNDLGITSDYLEYDHGLGEQQMDLIYGRENLKVHVAYPEGIADIKAKYAFYDVDKEIGKMKQDVIVTYKHDKHGTVNANSDEAIHNNKEKLIALRGNVTSYGSKSDLNVSGNDVVLDLNTGIIKSKGKSGFTYSFDKSDPNAKKRDGEEVSDNKLKQQAVQEFEEDIESANRISDDFGLDKKD